MSKKGGPTEEDKGPPMISATPEQMAAAQRMQDSHAMLKIQFADAFVAMTLAQQEREAFAVELRGARETIVQLTEELKNSTKSKKG